MSHLYQFSVRPMAGIGGGFCVAANIVPVVDQLTEASARALAELLNVTVREFTRTELVAHVKFLGHSEGFQEIEGFNLYNLLEPVAGFPAGATVTLKTLQEKGIGIIEVIDPKIISVPLVPSVPFQIAVGGAR